MNIKDWNGVELKSNMVEEVQNSKTNSTLVARIRGWSYGGLWIRSSLRKIPTSMKKKFFYINSFFSDLHPPSLSSLFRKLHFLWDFIPLDPQFFIGGGWTSKEDTVIALLRIQLYQGKTPQQNFDNLEYYIQSSASLLGLPEMQIFLKSHAIWRLTTLQK